MFDPRPETSRGLGAPEQSFGGYLLSISLSKSKSPHGIAELRLKGSQESLYFNFSGVLDDDGILVRNPRMVLVYRGRHDDPDNARLIGRMIVERGSAGDFGEKLKGYLDRVYGEGRPSAQQAVAALFRHPDLVNFAEWNLYARPQRENSSVFNITVRSDGRTRVIPPPSPAGDGPVNPVSLWQLHGGLKCLGFVQSAYDVLFGPGASLRVGLATRGRDIAERLDLRALQQHGCEVLSGGSYREAHPPPGTVFRLQHKDRDAATHVGICLGPDQQGIVRVAHMIEGTVLIEPWSKFQRNEGVWRVETAIKPPRGYAPIFNLQDPLESLIECKNRDGRPFPKGTQLGQIVSDLRRQHPRLGAAETEHLADMIYQFNRTKFDMTPGAGSTIGESCKLRGDFTISIPEELLGVRRPQRRSH